MGIRHKVVVSESRTPPPKSHILHACVSAAN